MNIQEAIKTGRRIKRKGWDSNYYLDPVGRGMIRFELPVGDLAADDWEVEPVEITITDQQFWKAAVEAVNEEMEHRGVSYLGRSDFPTVDDLMAYSLGRLATKLGLTNK